MLSEREADELVAADKYIGEVINWRTERSKLPRYRFEVTVACPEPWKPLRLIGVAGPVNYSFSLLTMQNQIIRLINRHIGGHRNPDGSDAGEQHKHRWTDAHESRESYVPTDIDWTDPNTVLRGFLQECHITAHATIEELYRQTGF